MYSLTESFAKIPSNSKESETLKGIVMASMKPGMTPCFTMICFLFGVIDKTISHIYERDTSNLIISSFFCQSRFIYLKMNYFKKILLTFLITCFSCDGNQTERLSQLTISIPTTGNSWVINDVFQSSEVISEGGITNWSDRNQIIRTYFYIDKPTVIPFGINAKGNSEIKITFGTEFQNITLSNSEFQNIYIGDFNAVKKGYHYIDMQGLKKEDTTFAWVNEILFSNTIDSTTLKYIKDDFYFGRRGPSTHLIFQTPKDVEDIEWYYSEIEIDKGQDVF